MAFRRAQILTYSIKTLDEHFEEKLEAFKQSFYQKAQEVGGKQSKLLSEASTEHAKSEGAKNATKALLAARYSVAPKPAATATRSYDDTETDEADYSPRGPSEQKIQKFESSAQIFTKASKAVQAKRDLASDKGTKSVVLKDIVDAIQAYQDNNAREQRIKEQKSQKQQRGGSSLALLQSAALYDPVEEPVKDQLEAKGVTPRSIALGTLIMQLEKIDPAKLVATDNVFSQLKAKTWGTGAQNELIALLAFCRKKRELSLQPKGIIADMRKELVALEGKHLAEKESGKKALYNGKMNVLKEIIKEYEEKYNKPEKLEDLEAFKRSVDTKAIALKAYIQAYADSQKKGKKSEPKEGKGGASVYVKALSDALAEEIRHLKPPEPKPDKNKQQGYDYGSQV